MSKITTIIRSLTVEEQQQLKDELLRNYDLWEPHGSNKYNTMLQDGRSIHVNSVINGKVVHSLFDKFPLTHQILKLVAEDRTIARVYWHKLEWNDKILPHNDSLVFDVVENRLDNRYQIYLECPDNRIMIDNRAINSKKFENTIVDFDLTQQHSFVNHSPQPWVFLVFDVLKPNVNFI